ncbi:hypothetical protein D3C78_567100 [compost metagenome]
MGAGHLRRSADRAAADPRGGEYRAGSPTGAGACLLAPERPGGGSGDLERGPRRLPAAPAGPDHGPDRLGDRCQPDRPPGRGLRAPRPAAVERGPHPDAVGRPRHPQRRPWQPGRAGAPAPRGAAAAALRAEAAAPRRHGRAARRSARARGGRADPAQPLRRLQRGRRRISGDPAAGAGDPGALGQRAGQSRIRHRPLREWRRLYLERERPRVPPDALAERSGRRCQRRGVVPARRVERPLLVADPVAAPGQRRVRDPPRLRLQRVRAQRGRHPHRAVGVRGAGCADQVFPAQGSQRLGAPAPAVRHRLCRVGAGRPARQIGDARGQRSRPARCLAGAQRLFARVSRPGGVLRCRRAESQRHRRPQRVHRPQRQPAGTGSADPGAAVRAYRRRAGPLRGDPGRLRAGRRGQPRAGVPPGRGARRRGGARPAAALPWQRGGGRGARRRAGALARDAGPGAGGNARSGGRRAGQRLVAVPGHRLSLLGAQRLLPVRRGVRLPRPAAGRHGDAPRRTARRAPAPAAVRLPPVPRGRRAALVASAAGARRAHPVFRRLPVAGPGHQPLCAGHRGSQRARRAGRLHRGPPAGCGRRVLLRPAGARAAGRNAVSALRAGHRARHGPRRPWPAADRRRRLERRHEPGRRAGPRRKRVAGFLPLRGAAELCRDRARVWRRTVRPALRGAGRHPAGQPRGAWLGW